MAGAAVTDWFDWYDLADMNVWSGYGLGGSPWIGKNEAAYRAQSPITYASRIKTPMLIVHGEKNVQLKSGDEIEIVVAFSGG